MALWKAQVTVQRTKDEHLIVRVEADTEEEAKEAHEGGPVSIREIELAQDEDDEEDNED